MVHNGLQWSNLAKKWSTIDLDGSKQLFQNVLKWSKMVQNGSKWST